jgi:hypothetical protein
MMPWPFSRPRRKRIPSGPRYARLGLERLETRDCPSLAVMLGSPAVMPGHIARVDGMVSGNNPGGVAVTLTGAMSGATTTDAYGHFTYMTQNATLGTVTATAVDGQGGSASASAPLVKQPPSVGLSIMYGSQRTVTLMGRVSDMDAGGRTVTFTGKVTGSTTTASDGSFSFTTQASALGAVQATTTDLWGQTSSPAQANVTSMAPQIINFTASASVGNLWVFRGQVIDESAPGLTVTFGGLAQLAGQTTTVASDGSFTFSVFLPAGTYGEATALTTDWWGLQSNLAVATLG